MHDYSWYMSIPLTIVLIMKNVSILIYNIKQVSYQVNFG